MSKKEVMTARQKHLNNLKETIENFSPYKIDDIVLYDNCLHIVTSVGYSFDTEEKCYFSYSINQLTLKADKFSYEKHNLCQVNEEDIDKKVCSFADMCFTVDMIEE